MVGGLLVVAILALAGVASCASPDLDPIEALDVNKRDLEFNQYVPGYRLRGEPSCEELRAMWRLSKREARRATSTNQLPRSHPYSYGRLMAFAPDPNARPTKHVYGSVYTYPKVSSSSSLVPQQGAFNKLRSLMGPGDRRGKYAMLAHKVATSRGPGESSKGKYDELRQRIREQERPVTLALRAAVEDSYKASPPRREPKVEMSVSPRTMRGSTHFSQQGFVGQLLPADSSSSSSRVTSFKPWQPSQPSDPSTRTCSEVRRSYCRADSDCACAGLYRCNKGRCKVSAKQPVVEDSMGAWYNGPVEDQDLGAWGRRPMRQP